MVPHKKCEATLKLIHEGHLGLGKCKLRAKDTVHWPRLNDQLEKMILSCELCLKYSQAKCKSEPTKTLGQEIPVHPWSKIAPDIFHFEGATYLLIVDYTRRFPIVHRLTSITGKHIANQCKSVFTKCLMIYCNTPLTGSLQTPMQILQRRSARSDLPMSNVRRSKLGLKAEVLRNVDKHEKLLTHDLHIGQHAMHQSSASK